MSGGIAAACVEINAALELHRRCRETERRRKRPQVRRRLLRRQIEEALEACEQAALGGPPRLAPDSVVELILELQEAQQRPARRPVDAVAAHEMLLDLQKRHLLAGDEVWVDGQPEGRR